MWWVINIIFRQKNAYSRRQQLLTSFDKPRIYIYFFLFSSLPVNKSKPLLPEPFAFLLLNQKHVRIVLQELWWNHCSITHRWNFPSRFSHCLYGYFRFDLANYASYFNWLDCLIFIIKFCSKFGFSFRSDFDCFSLL